MGSYVVTPQPGMQYRVHTCTCEGLVVNGNTTEEAMRAMDNLRSLNEQKKKANLEARLGRIKEEYGG